DSVAYATPHLPLIPTGPADVPMTTAAYWTGQIEAPVQFGAAVTALAARGIPTLRPDRAWPDPLTALAQAWVAGVPLTRPDATTRRRVSLPTYPFDRRRCWIANPADPLARASVPEPLPFELRRIHVAGSARVHFETGLSS